MTQLTHINSRLTLRPSLAIRVIGLLLLLTIVTIGCSRGSYPLDIFYEMHYQQSYESSEPPRLSAPAGAVPVTGKAVLPKDNPIPGQRIDDGRRLYISNCAFCHGLDGKGTGSVLEIMRTKYGYGTDEKPYAITPDLTSDFVGNQADIAIFGWITNGVVVMPSFAKLLTVEERWALVNYVRSLKE